MKPLSLFEEALAHIRQQRAELVAQRAEVQARAADLYQDLDRQIHWLDQQWQQLIDEAAAERRKVQ